MESAFKAALAGIVGTENVSDRLMDRVALRTMQIVKCGLDPLNILNPGKMGLE